MASGELPGGVPPPTPPATGRYALLDRLAVGGMAEIYLARMTGPAGFEKLVVVKRVLPNLAVDPSFVAMFLREARIAARVSHPNVCQILELGQTGHDYFLAMEYLDGLPLARVMRASAAAGEVDGRGPDLRLAGGLIVQAAEGLHHAHDLVTPDGRAAGVIHRDISPQNLFVTAAGTVKLLDFGIARARGERAVTSVGTIKGKLPYMAPEQLRGAPADRRTDIFALGVVLFEVVTGRGLFHRGGDPDTVRAITEEPIPRVRDVRGDVPPQLDEAIARALARDPDGRFATARDLGLAVGAALRPLGGPLGGAEIAEALARLCPDELEAVRARVRAALRRADAGEAVGELVTGEVTAVPTSPTWTPAGPGAAAAAAAAAAAPDGGPFPGDPATEELTFPEPPAHLRGEAPGAAARPALGDEPVTADLTTAGGARPLARVSPPALTPPPARSSSGPAPREAVSAPRALPEAAEPSAAPGPSRSRRRGALVAVVGLAAVAAVAIALARGGSSGGRVPSGRTGGEAGRALAAPPRAAPPDAWASTAAPLDAAPPDAVPARPPRPDAAVRAGGRVGPPPREPPGFFSVDSRPYARIYVDGRHIGDTPIYRHALAPGRHVVRAACSNGRSRTFRIQIRSGVGEPARLLTW